MPPISPRWEMKLILMGDYEAWGQHLRWGAILLILAIQSGFVAPGCPFKVKNRFQQGIAKVENPDPKDLSLVYPWKRFLAIDGAETQNSGARSQESGARSQNRLMSLHSYPFYVFRLSRRRIPYSEFCLLSSVFLSALITAEPIISDLALRAIGSTSRRPSFRPRLRLVDPSLRVGE